MEITNVGIRLVASAADRLKAFCTITIDDAFVVRDLRVVEGPSGLFVAMPSRKRTRRCPDCGHKNELRARYCNECAASLPPERTDRTPDGKSGSHTDIAHPINSECREVIQHRVLDAYEEEIRAAEEAARARQQREAAARPAEPAAPAPRQAPRPGPRPATHTTRPVPAPPRDDNEAFGAGIL